MYGIFTYIGIFLITLGVNVQQVNIPYMDPLGFDSDYIRNSWVMFNWDIYQHLKMGAMNFGGRLS